jgi:non-specific serine/threonine protein kinase
VFPGEFDLEAAEQICSGDGIAREDVFDVLAGLLDKSVVTRSPYAKDARYRLLETVRQYGQSVLGRSGQDGGLRRRHSDHYLRLSRRAEAEWFGPRQVESLARLQREQANLRAALEFCLSDPAEASRGLEIMLALWNYWVFFTGSFDEGRHWLREGLALYTERTALRAGALRVDAWFALRQADIGAALPLLAECRDLAREVGDTTSAAFAVHFSGLAAYLSGDVTRGVSLLEQARAEHQANDDQEGVWMVLFHLVSAYSTRGDPRSAEACAAECLAMCEARSAYLSRSNALWMLGLARWFEGDQKQAAMLIRRGLEVMHRLNDTWGIAECLEVLAWIAAADGRDDYAARLFGAAAMVWRSMGTDQPEFHPFADSHNLCETQLRKALGDQAYAAALRRGAELTVEQAVDQALDRDRPAKPPSKPQAGEAPLTAREREVAVLIARGLSNKDIAGNLVISQRTAEGHVEHILAKLGFSSRVQIATWAGSHLGPAFSM